MTRETKKLFKVKRKITPLTVLVPLLLKGLTLIVTLGVTAWLRSTWVEKP